MSTIKTGTTTTTGLIVEADTSGNLVVQTGATPTTALTISGTNQQITFAQQPVVPVPAFRAYLSADQNVTSGVATKVQIDTKTGDGYFDTNGWFDTTDNRYTPQIAGYYSFSFQLRGNAYTPDSQTLSVIYPYKNGSQYTSHIVHRTTTTAPMGGFISVLMYMNGSTDYCEFWAQVNGTSVHFDFNTEQSTCVFEGFLVRAA